MSGSGSNTAARIGELRRRIASNKGKAKRARDMAKDLTYKAFDCERQVRCDMAEIEAMGGKVRR